MTQGMVQVSAVAVVALLCAVTIRRGAAEISMVLMLAAGVWMLMMVLDDLAAVIQTMENLAEVAQLDDALIAPVLKTVVITMVTKVTCDLCRSAGEGGIASFVELAGTILALAVALPLVEGVVAMMMEILG